MRAALWLLALFSVAVAIALFAGNNQGTVTVFWPPYRIDLSLNMVLLLGVAAFVLLHAALRGLSALFNLPREALRWRNQQKERTLHLMLVDAIAHLTAGRRSLCAMPACVCLTASPCAPWPTCWWPRAPSPCRIARPATST
jgi:HemY protein